MKNYKGIDTTSSNTGCSTAGSPGPIRRQLVIDEIKAWIIWTTLNTRLKFIRNKLLFRKAEAKTKSQCVEGRKAEKEDHKILRRPRVVWELKGKRTVMFSDLKLM